MFVAPGRKVGSPSYVHVWGCTHRIGDAQGIEVQIPRNPAGYTSYSLALLAMEKSKGGFTVSVADVKEDMPNRVICCGFGRSVAVHEFVPKRPPKVSHDAKPKPVDSDEEFLNHFDNMGATKKKPPKLRTTAQTSSSSEENSNETSLSGEDSEVEMLKKAGVDLDSMHTSRLKKIPTPKDFFLHIWEPSSWILDGREKHEMVT